MIEAICVGLPVISTKVSGTNELIKDKETGCLVDLDNEMMLSSAMSFLMGNETVRKEMSHRNIIKSNTIFFRTFL